jgi:uncharacterized protein (DUF924 family)
MSDKILLDLHCFWFGDIKNGRSASIKQELWYGADPKTDNDITEKYAALHQKAADGDLIHWQKSAKGVLGLVIVLDQLSRNIYRGQSDAFGYDGLALDYCLNGLELGMDKKLEIVERLFFYHPLMHSESLSCQQLCVELMELMLQDCNKENQAIVENSINFAQQHRDIIEQYGRFPYRNEVLGRSPSTAEIKYLSGSGKRFGQ